MKNFPVILIALLMVACAPSPQVIQAAIAQTQAAWTRVPTQTPYPTQTPNPTYTVPPAIYITKIVTLTFTDTPLFTPTITNTATKTLIPSKTPLPTPTIDPLRLPEQDGNYLVGVDIAPGVWRNDGAANDCYWERTTRTGDIIDNYLGAGGGTAYIAASDFAFRSVDCDTWTFLSPP